MEDYKPVEVYPLVESDDWMKLTGKVPYKMTNDYLFRALLQSDNETLKALLASVLRVDVREIRSAKVANPILLGEALGEKTFVMDVKVELNNTSLIDLEMQVIREKWWTDRSLSYICRAFDNLNKGLPYDTAKPVRQIAFCDFTLFREHPEFYATYKLINEKDINRIYTDKLVISNMDLTRPDLATEEDREYKLDDWCRLFKAEDWEEMKMLAAKNEMIGRAISGVWQLTEEEQIREQCRAREDWIINARWKTEKIAEQAETIAEQKGTIAELTQAKEELLANEKKQADTIAEQEAELAKYREQFGPLKKETE